MPENIFQLCLWEDMCTVQWLNSAGTDRNGVPQPVCGLPPPEIAVPPPKVVAPTPEFPMLHCWI